MAAAAASPEDGGAGGDAEEELGLQRVLQAAHGSLQAQVQERQASVHVLQQDG